MNYESKKSFIWANLYNDVVVLELYLLELKIFSSYIFFMRKIVSSYIYLIKAIKKLKNTLRWQKLEEVQVLWL